MSALLPSRAGAVVRAAVLGLLLALIGVLAAPSANAAAYRYWGYFQLKGDAWSFSPKGSAQIIPANGSVEGWRWAAVGDKDSRTPRDVLTFDQICGNTPAEAGKKRVGVVLDFGRVADAEYGNPPSPTAKCAVVPTAANGTQVLQAATQVRTGAKGMICGLNQWPSKGCGGAVPALSSNAAAKDVPVTIAAADNAAATKDEGVAAWKIVVPAAVVLVLLLGALFLVLRRRRADVDA